MKILVIADVHGNAEALSAILQKESDADTTVFLGDALLPGPQPNETTELLQRLSGTLILGNHDVEMLGANPVSHWPDKWRALGQWVVETLDSSGYSLLRSLKPEGDYLEGGVRMRLSHGLMSGQHRHGVPDTPDERLATLADGSDCPVVLFGHSHVQFTRTINGQQFINPGSVGQSRCGTRVACYGLFEDGVFRHCHVEYDPRPWLEAMDRVKTLDEFPEFRQWLKQAFLSGFALGETEPWTRYASEGYL